MCVAGLALAVVVLVLAASFRGPPRNPEDICAIFQERRSWYRAAERSAQEWEVPVDVQMAVIYHESGFRARARPPRRWILRIIPWRRPSSAYGFCQALDSTWRAYQKATSRPYARRDHFADATDFIGWYGDQVHRINGIAKNDAYRFYLAYHEGPGGYARGTHLEKPWLLKVARRVEERAGRYRSQYDGCRRRLERWWIFW